MKTAKSLYLCIYLVCTTVMLFGCNLHTDSPETINTTALTNNTVSVALTEPKTLDQTHDLEDASAENREEVNLIFNQILFGNSYFKVEGVDEEVTIEDYCNTWGPSSTTHISQYGFADLDYDKEPELILRLAENDSTDLGMLVIRYDNNRAIGYEFTYRQMIDLKADGTFAYSGGTNDTGYAKLRFSEGSWEYEKICNIVENDDITSFFCRGESISEDIYWKIVNEQKQKKGLEWFDYS